MEAKEQLLKMRDLLRKAADIIDELELLERQHKAKLIDDKTAEEKLEELMSKFILTMVKLENLKNN